MGQVLQPSSKLSKIPLDSLSSHLKELPDIFTRYGSIQLGAIMRALAGIRVEGDMVILDFPDKYTHHRQEVEKNRPLIEEILENWVGMPIRVYGNWEKLYEEHKPTPQTAPEIRESSAVAYRPPSAVASGVNISQLREAAVLSFKKGEIQKAQGLVQDVRNQQSNDPKRLSRSLFYIANKIRDLQTKLALFSEAVDRDPHNEYALANYGRLLAKNKQFNKAFEMFERALQVNPNNAVTLSIFGGALLENGRVQEAGKLLKRSLEIKPNDALTLCNYGKALAVEHQYEQAYQMFEHAQKIRPNDHRILSAYGRVLAEVGNYESACEMFDQALRIQPRDPMVLTNYAKSLIELNQVNQAFDKFELALASNPHDTITLNTYGVALAECGQPDKAFSMFERSLKIRPDDKVTLTGYGKALATYGRQGKSLEVLGRARAIAPNDTAILNTYGNILADYGQFDKAIETFQHSLQLNPNNIVALTGYGNVLYHLGRTEDAVEQLNQALQIDPNNVVSLVSYAKIHAGEGEIENAREKFEQVLAIKPYDPVALFRYAALLEREGEYDTAIEYLERINRSDIPQHLSVFFAVILGRLYYLIQQESKGNEYFDFAVSHSHDADREEIRIIWNLITISPYNDEVIERLKRIGRSSLQISQLLDPKDYFDIYEGGAKGKIETLAMLNKALYHRLKNALAILKGKAYLISFDNESLCTLSEEIVHNIDSVFSRMDERRKREQKMTENLLMDDYSKILNIVSKTAHDISDIVNAELPVIASKLHSQQSDFDKEDPSYQAITELLNLVEETKSDLNDLKSINGGINIHRRTFKVFELFQTWATGQHFQHATISIDIQNAQEEFVGDAPKIRGFIKELIENSVNHNPYQKVLHIGVVSRDVNGLPSYVVGLTERQTAAIPVDRRFLNIIIQDNGKGIPQDQKAWVFLPLTTTSENGTGLGLYIIKQTLKQMKGYIIENGTQGVNFEIYIPYNLQR